MKLKNMLAEFRKFLNILGAGLCVTAIMLIALHFIGMFSKLILGQTNVNMIFNHVVFVAEILLCLICFIKLMVYKRKNRDA